MKRYTSYELKRLSLKELEKELKKVEDLNFINLGDKELNKYIELIKEEIKLKKNLEKNITKIPKKSKKEQENERG